MKKITFWLIALFLSWQINAQVSNYSFSQSNSTFTPLSGGTVLATATANSIAGSMDSYNSSAINLPFNFTFNGTSVSTVYMNGNGFLSLGATAPSTTTSTPISTASTATGIISAFGGDLNTFFNLGSRTGEMKWDVVGNAPDREIVFEWKDFRPAYSTSTTNAYGFSFQVRLVENGNLVKVVYGPGSFAIGSTAVTGTSNRQIGLRGSTNADFNNRVFTSFASPSTSGTLNTSANSFSTATNFPSNGLTLLWSPPLPCSGTPAPGNTLASVANPCYGASVTLSLQNTNMGTGLTYQWYLNGVAISGANASTYVVSSITSTNTYYCEVTCSGNTAASTALVLSPSILNAPILEPFNTFLPTCWTNMFGGNLTTGPTATTGSGWAADGFANNGTTGAISNNIYTTGANDWVISPVINIPASGYELKFDAAATQYASTTAPTTQWESDDYIEVLIATGGSTTGWTALYTYNGTNQPSNTGITNVIDLSAYAGQNIRIAFHAVEGSNDGGADIDFSIDNFQIRLTPLCPDMTGLIVSGVTSSGANTSWNDMSNGGALGYEYAVTTSATPPASGTATTSTFYIASGLTPQTVYYLHVRSSCTGGTFGNWSTITFTTACGEVTSFIQNFDTVTTPAFPNCWFKVGTTGTVNTQNSSSSSTPNCLYIYGSSATNQAIVRTIPVSNLGAGTHRFKFKMRANFTVGGILELGYLTNPTDSNSFVAFTSFTASSLTYADYVYNVPAGTYSNYPAFRHTGSPANSILVDDVVWEALPSCPDMTGLVVSGVTAFGANTSWDDMSNGGALGYEYAVTTSATPPASGTATTSTFYVASGLTPQTVYYLHVRSSCTGGTFGNWSTISFTTACAPVTVFPVLEPFATFLPSCWLKGDNGTLTAGPATLGTNSWAADGFGNVGTTGAIKYNIYLASANDWIISPQYTIPASGYELRFNAAATNYAATTAVTNWESDDFVEVLVSTTGTDNWSVLYTYNNSNVPAPTGTMNVIDLDSYAGQTVRFAYRAVEGTADGSADIDFFVDDFEIRLSPTCPDMTGLVVSGVTAFGANTSWNDMSNGGALGYEYAVTTSATPPTSGTATTSTFYVASGLSPQTIYYLHVRATCSSGVYGNWSTITFTTACAPITALPWNEGFEGLTTVGATNFPSCWFKENGDWTSQNTNGTYSTANTGTKYIRNSWSATNEFIWTPGFDLVAGTSYDFSSFIQGDNGTGWAVDYFVNTTQNSTGATQIGSTYNVPGTGSTYAAQAYNKVTATFVPTTTGTYYFAVRVNQPSSSPWYVSFDDFALELTPACPSPNSNTITSLTPTSATITWNTTSGAYEYVIDNLAANPTTAGTAITTNTYSPSSLTPNTVYYVHVRSNCNGSLSPWYTFMFTTPLVPPANDNCSGAIVLTPGATFNTNPLTANLTGATNSNPPAPGCASFAGGDVWYSVVVPASGSITIETGGTFTGGDTGMAVYSGTCGNLVLVSCDDDSSSNGSYSLISLTNRTAGEILYVNTWQYNTGVSTISYQISAYDASLSSSSFDMSSFVAYPNPVKDVLNLSYSSTITNVKVTNLLGQQVINKNANDTNVQVNMADLAVGTYIVNISSGDLIHTIKVIKQ